MQEIHDGSGNGITRYSTSIVPSEGFYQAITRNELGNEWGTPNIINRFNIDGSGYLAMGNIIWDTDGNVTITGIFNALTGGTIGGFTINTTELSTSSTNNGVTYTSSISPSQIKLLSASTSTIWGISNGLNITSSTFAYGTGDTGLYMSDGRIEFWSSDLRIGENPHSNENSFRIASGYLWADGILPFIGDYHSDIYNVDVDVTYDSLSSYKSSHNNFGYGALFVDNNGYVRMYR